VGQNFIVLRSARGSLELDQLLECDDSHRRTVQGANDRVRQQLLIRAAAGHFAEKVNRSERGVQREVHPGVQSPCVPQKGKSEWCSARVGLEVTQGVNDASQIRGRTRVYDIDVIR
jgi:hypothetical protein